MIKSKSSFILDVKSIITNQLQKHLEVDIFISGDKELKGVQENKLIFCKKIDFLIDFKKEIFDCFELESYKINLYFNNIEFESSISLKNLKLNLLSFKEVTFNKNVGIKQVSIDTIIFRPYQINANVVINVDNYANSTGLIVDSRKYYINNIEFEDPHICNGKIFFVGTNFKNGNFRNRQLENVVFQNCDFENTFFLNSFLKKTTFLNCKFPKIKNHFMSYFLPENMNFSMPIIFSILIAYFLFNYESFLDLKKTISNVDILLLIISTIPLLFFMVFLSFFLYWCLEEFFSYFFKIFPGNQKTLLNHHIGLADERLINKFDLQIFNLRKRQRDVELKTYKKSLNNLNSIYNDLKVNFQNSLNPQIAGDFHYSYNYNKIILSDRLLDAFVLKMSYVLNGFGERFGRSLVLIISILFILGFFSTPNEDYISTPATPPFLLEVEYNEELPIIYKESGFLEFAKNNNKKFISGEQFYAYDNRFDFNFKTQKIIELKKDSLLVRVYYATSHITYPFTQESKKWFQNISKSSYFFSIPLTILLWLSLIGMVTAIFNRIRR